MFLVEVKEFGSNSTIGVINKSILFVDRYHIYDMHLKPLFESPHNNSYVYFVSNEIWLDLDIHSKKSISKRISVDTWSFDKESIYKHTSSSAKINEKLFFVENSDGGKFIVAHQGSGFHKKVNAEKIYSSLTSIGNYLYAAGRDGSTYCFDSDLTEIWRVKKDKVINELHLRFPISFDDLLIVNVGEDRSGRGGNFELNAYQYDTGELRWQLIFEASPSSNHLVDDKLYVCVKNRFFKIDAKTGIIELEAEFDYRTFDDQKGVVSMVYPVQQGLLCFNHQNHFIELRSHDASCVLQTIRLPETYAFHLSGETPIVDSDGAVYFPLGHLLMGLNTLKSAVAVLTPNDSAPEYHEAQLEPRPPLSVESIVDDAGKNGYRVRIGGASADHIIRYAHIVLKELAYNAGVPGQLLISKVRDKRNAGTLLLEIATNDLPGDKNKNEWREVFGVIKTRVEKELKMHDVIAGDGKSDYQVSITIV